MKLAINIVACAYILHISALSPAQDLTPTSHLQLWFLFNPRINLSPFTKDFRGEEHFNESIDLFFKPLASAGAMNEDVDLS